LIKTDEVIIKIVSKLESEYGNVINLYKTKELLEEVLFEYDVVDKEKALIIVNSDLQEKIFLFLASKKIDGLSDCSLNSYRLHLRRFARSMNKNVADINAMDIRIYLANYAKTGVKVNTIATEQSILKSFFGWLEAEEYISKNPMRLIKPIKAEKRIRKPLSKEIIEKLVDGAVTLRQKAIILLLYSSGIRVSELVSLNKSDINWHDKSFYVIGKGDKERKTYFSARAQLALQKYLESRSDNNAALFVSHIDPYDRLSRRTIEREVKEIAQNANVDRSVFPHIFRHSFASHLLSNGADITVVKELLGHSSVATSEIYSQISNTEIEHQYKKHSL
jgi:integrase/recombinase XerD